MGTLRTALLTVLLGVSGAAFAPAPGVAQEEQQARPVSVAVENRATVDVRVYALQGGHMVPLGMVQKSSEATLSLPGAFLESSEGVQLIAEHIGGDTWYKSEPVAIRAGSRVALNIAENLERSSVSVRG